MLTRYARRVTRTAAVLMACLLLGVTMVAASQISQRADDAVASTVDANWRGHYDLLVTAAGGLTAAAEETDGLIEQNFSTLRAEESITAGQLDSISSLSDVEVAAPLAFVGQFANPSYSAPVGVSADDWASSEFFESPRAFDGSIRTFYHDAMGEHLLAEHPVGHFMVTGVGEEEVVLQWLDEETGDVASQRGGLTIPDLRVVDVPESEQCECLVLAPTHSVTEDSGPGTVVDDGHTTTHLFLEDPEDADEALEAAAGTASVYTDYTVVPELYSNMVAVDPAAERALLGEEGGFLDGLIEFEELQDSLGAGPCDGEIDDDRPPGSCLADLVDPEKYEQIHSQVFHGNPSQEEGDGTPESPAGPIIPIVYSETEYPEMTAEASFPELAVFEDLSFEEATTYEFYQDVLEGERPTDPETQEAELTENLTPFVYEGFDVRFGLGDWAPPQVAGSADSPAGTSTWMPGRAERHGPTAEQQASAPDGVETLLVNVPQGRYHFDTGMTSSEQRYRPWSPNYEVTPPPRALLAPVGSYSPGLAGSSEDASYVPLGMYADAAAQIVSGGDMDGMDLPPSFSGRGALLNSPGVITTMRGFEQYREEVAADVVRVRVSDVDGYSAESLRRIDDVAEQIRDLGLDAQVVAGSSLAPVAVYLPEFHDDGSDLGWTVEEWTSLGAAVQTEEAQTAASWLLLVVALSGVTVLACTVQLSGTRTRRREASLLLSVGWTRGRVRRWFLAEDLPALLLVTGAALASAALAASASATGPATAALAFCAAVVAGTIRTVLPMRPPRSHAQGSPVPARAPTTVGRRLAWSSPGAVTMTALALLVLVTTAVAFTLVILTARTQAGVSRIAGLVNAEVLLPQTVLAGGAVIAGGVMFIMAIRQTLRQARRQHQMLLSAGWPSASLASSIRAQLLMSLAPGALLALLVGVTTVALLDPGQPQILTAVILGVLAAAATAVLIWSRRYVASLIS